MIIDSSSPISWNSVVTNEVCSYINEDVSKFCKINRSQLKILNIFYSEVEIQDVDTKIKFYIMPDNTMIYKVLLGRDFLMCTLGDIIGDIIKI